MSTERSSSTAISAHLPTPRVPIRSAKPMVSAGDTVAARTTSARGIPRARHLLMTVGRSYAGPSTAQFSSHQGENRAACAHPFAITMAVRWIAVRTPSAK